MEKTYHNNYNLIDEDIENNMAASKEIDKILKSAARSIQKVAKKYKKVGIGDTSTDEAISNVFYYMIH